MSPLAQRVAGAVYRNSPRALCFGCVAAEQGLQEHDVRGVAVVLVARAGLRLARRACSSCHRVDELLLVKNVA